MLREKGEAGEEEQVERVGDENFVKFCAKKGTGT